MTPDMDAEATELCELWLKGEWEPITLERALTLDPSRRKRCIECGGQVQAHKLGTTGQRAHFEHKRAHKGCSLGDCFDGAPRLHPKALL